MSSRRVFLKSGALALFAAGLGGVPTFVARAAQSRKLWRPYKKNKILDLHFPAWRYGRTDGRDSFYRCYLQKARPGLFMSAA
jgi:hypothetical protein